MVVIGKFKNLDLINELDIVLRIIKAGYGKFLKYADTFTSLSQEDLEKMVREKINTKTTF